VDPPPVQWKLLVQTGEDVIEEAQVVVGPAGSMLQVKGYRGSPSGTTRM
jgi:hypothetical protein